MPPWPALTSSASVLSGSKNASGSDGKGKGRGYGKSSGKNAGQNAGKGKGSGKMSSKEKGFGKGDEQGRSDHTLHFYSIDEVLSAMQKAVRRGHARNAAFWAGELHVSGLTKIAVTRLCIMTVEDVGIASPYAPFVANAVQALLLRSEDAFKDWARPAELHPSLILVCGLARWVASLPKTRTSNMLAGFQQAKAEERRRSAGEASGPLQPCGVEDVSAALGILYSRCIGDLGGFLLNPRQFDEAHLRLEEDVFLQAYAYQLCQQKEALAFDPLFDALGRGMMSEEERLKSNLQAARAQDPAHASQFSDFVSGFATVRSMVSNLQHLCKEKGVLDSAARMCLAQALLLATRAHHLVSEGIIVVPSFLATASARGSTRDGDSLCTLSTCDLVTVCCECKFRRLDGLALSRHNARVLSHYARAHAGRSPGTNASVALNYEDFVHNEVFSAGVALIPRDLFECLQRPAVDAQARYLHVPPYCVDVHTRRGSGYPMHRDWENRIQLQNPGLQDWDSDEVKKTHGALDDLGRQMASQFSRYGLVVSDEYFPGPSQPGFSMAPALRPADWQRFQANVLPVAALDHGATFVDRRHFPDGYGAPWGNYTQSSIETLCSKDEENCSLTELLSSSSETAALLARRSPAPEGGQYCTCSHRNVYANPATPQDPYFCAAKTFKSWTSENSFPSRIHFPKGRLPKVLESIAFNTINDDPDGKKLSQTEHLLELIDGSVQGLPSADEKRSAIDSRPSIMTEFHRAWMHEAMQSAKSTGVQNTTFNDRASPALEKNQQSITEGALPSQSTPAPGSGEAECSATSSTGAKQSRWKRKPQAKASS